MITCELLGRLGNHLFQAAATIKVAEQLGVDFVIPTTAKAGHHGTIRSEFHAFEYPFKMADIKTANEFDQKVFHYVPIDVKDDLTLKGFYQSYQYFDSIRDKLINKYFKFNDRVKAAVDRYIVPEHTLGICVRGGDYFQLQQNHNVLQRPYYQLALNKIRDWQLEKIFVFSDDFSWCHLLFSDVKDDMIFVEDDKFIQFYLMTKMKHLILANSTFSWWGAFLNDRGGKIIIPDTWFGPSNQHLDTSGLYYPSWIKTRVDGDEIILI